MPSALRANITFPTRYRFGWGRRSELVAEARAAGIHRALVVTDRGVAAQPWFPALAATLADELGAEVVDGVSTNPTEPEVLEGVAAYRAHGCDGVIAIGGGSPMDAAKVVALLAGHGAGAPGDAAAFALGGDRARGIRGDAIRPIVCVPTTSGTGSELSIGAVISDPAAKVKRTLLHAGLMPRAVVADPEVTLGLPAAVTAATGLDALTHAIEALCAPGYHPMCDAIALEAARLIVRHLPRAVATPRDGDARAQLMMAASMAAVAFQKGLGLVHAMAHPLGAATGVHHGLANAVLLPLVLDVNRDAIGDACGRLLAALDAPAGAGDPVDAVIATIRALEAEVGLPATLPAPAGDLDGACGELAALAMDERLYLATNPRKVAPVEIATIYRRAFGA
ncbi:MAG: iron-containing alcohol dehydrogenase [Kofleriaceae bacterium]|nr:iron-containing alcohol dehydrogenase [Kofleriaceae bacterium]